MNKNVQQDVAFIRPLAALLRESELTDLAIARTDADNHALNLRL